MKNATYLYQGSVVALAPIAVSPPTDDKKNGGVLPRMDERVYIPASSVRGKLRRMARDEVRDALAAVHGREDVFTASDYFYLTVGGIKEGGGDDKKEKIMRIAEYGAIRDHNPLVSLFGANTPFLAGKAMIGMLLPETPVAPTNIKHVRSNDFQRTPDDMRFISDIDSVVNRMLRDSGNSKIKAEVKRQRSQAAKLQGDEKRAAFAKADALLESTSGAVAVGQPNLQYEAIPEGTVFSHKIVLRGVNVVEHGLFLRTLRRFSESPFIGAHAAHGAGEVEGTYEVYQIGRGTREHVGRVKVGFGVFEVTGDPGLAGIEAAWDEAAKDAGDLDFSVPAWVNKNGGGNSEKAASASE